MNEKDNRNIIIGIVAVVLILSIAWLLNSIVLEKNKDTITSTGVNAQVPITQTGTDNQGENIQTGTTTNTNLSTYTDNIYGFDLKYPNEFFDVGHEPTTFNGECNYEVFPDSCPDISKIITDLPKGASTGTIVNINNNPYCLYNYQDAGMGHVYNHYYYTTIKNNKCFIVKLETSTTNCDNYLPLEDGNTWQKENYEKCLEKNKNQPEILNNVVNSFKFSK